MHPPLIIAAATAGALATKAENPAVPYSAAEIADQIIACAEAGAALAHVHTRGPDGEATQNLDDYREIVRRVREHSDIIIELSLGSRGFTLEQALEPLVLKPLIASFPMAARQDADAGGDSLGYAARRILDNGTRPAFAITSPETRAMVLGLVEQGLGGVVPCISIGADPSGSTAEIAGRLATLIAELPPNAQWWAVKSGKAPSDQYAMRALAIAAGGHVRVGYEDTVKTYDGQGLASSNAWFVDEMVKLAKVVGREIATPAQARELLQLQG